MSSTDRRWPAGRHLRHLHPQHRSGQRNAGIPGLSIPAGLTASGLPAGLEIDGPLGSDDRLIGIGLSIEATLGAVPAPPV